MINTRYINDMQQTINGDGNITITNNVATCSAGAGSGRAFFSKLIDAPPSSSFEIEFDAKVDSGVLSCIVDVIDSTGATVTGVYSRINCEAGEWQTYRLLVTSPVNTLEGAGLKVNFGVFNAEAGSGKITDIKIKPLSYTIGAPLFIAAALIQRNPAGSAVSINPNYINHGIESVTYNSGTDKIEVVLRSLLIPNGAAFNPLASVEFTQEVSGTIVPRVGGLDRVNRKFFITFVDVTTGSFVAMPNGPWFMVFKALGA